MVPNEYCGAYHWRRSDAAFAIANICRATPMLVDVPAVVAQGGVTVRRARGSQRGGRRSWLPLAISYEIIEDIVHVDQMVLPPAAEL